MYKLNSFLIKKKKEVYVCPQLDKCLCVLSPCEQVVPQAKVNSAERLIAHIQASSGRNQLCLWADHSSRSYRTVVPILPLEHLLVCA